MQATLSLIGNADNGDVDDEGDGQLSLSYLPEHAAILLSVLTYAPIILPDKLFHPTVTLLLLTRFSATYFYLFLPELHRLLLRCTNLRVPMIPG